MADFINNHLRNYLPPITLLSNEISEVEKKWSIISNEGDGSLIDPMEQSIATSYGWFTMKTVIKGSKLLEDF